MIDEIRKLAVKLTALQRQGEALGMFTGAWELLECPVCGLWEDVDIHGRLLTCWRNDPAEDSGFRFQPPDNGRFRCPACGTFVTEKECETGGNAQWAFDPSYHQA